MRTAALLALLHFVIEAPAQLATAQQHVSGRVVDDRRAPLAGVNVYLPSTYEGASTDSLGRFAFATDAPLPLTLHTQCVGYRPDSAIVTDAAAPLSLHLRPSAAALAEVVVSAGAFVASDSRKTAVLSSVDVATTGSSADLAEALSTLPGSTPAGESGQLLVRGGTPEETQAYINGMRVPHLYTSRLPDVPSRTRFSPFAFDGIAFATGGFSAAYGDALSGALLLHTPGRPTARRTQLSAFTVGAEAAHTQPIGDDQAVAVGLGGTHLGAYAPLSRGAREMITRPPQGLTGQVAHWWEGARGRTLKTFAQGATQHYGTLDLARAPFYGSARLDLDNRNGYAQTVYQQPRGTTGLWTLGGAVAANRDAIAADTATVALDQLDAQARLTYADAYRDRVLWTAGAEHSLRRERFEAPGEDGDLTPAASAVTPYSAAFAEADWYLDSRWVVRAGIRAEAYGKLLPGGRDADARLSPRVQVSYLFSATHQLAASVGRYVQRQTSDSLFAREHDLRAASLDYYGLTYSRTWAGRVLRVEGYAKRYRDLVTRDSDGEFATDGHGYARGVDVFFRDRESVRDADFWVSYSYNESERLRGTLRERAPVPFAARHNVAVVAKRFFPSVGLGVSATYRYHSGRPYDDPNAAERFAATAPDLHDVSATATYLTQLRSHFTVVFAGLSNVAGARQVHQYRYAASAGPDGRYERLDVDNLFPRFPVVGAIVSLGDTDRAGSVDDI